MTREGMCTLCPLSFCVIENLPEKSPEGVKVRLAPVTIHLTQVDGSNTEASVCFLIPFCSTVSFFSFLFCLIYPLLYFYTLEKGFIARCHMCLLKMQTMYFKYSSGKPRNEYAEIKNFIA